MKKFTAALIAVAFICISSSAMAAGPKVPKEICLQIVSSPNVLYCLSTKSMGSIKFADNKKTTYYSINGSFHNANIPETNAIGGTGYMDGSLFRFHLINQFFSANNKIQSVKGYVDLSAVPVTGSAVIVFAYENDTVTDDTFAIQQIACSGVDAPNEVLQTPIEPTATDDSAFSAQ